MSLGLLFEVLLIARLCTTNQLVVFYYAGLVILERPGICDFGSGPLGEGLANDNDYFEGVGNRRIAESC